MDLMLVGISAVSFVIASGMALMAWKLLRDQDERSVARVALLRQAADDDTVQDGLLAFEPSPSVEPAAPPAAADMGNFDDDPWDFKRLDGAAASVRPVPRRTTARPQISWHDDAPVLQPHMFEPALQTAPVSSRRGLVVGTVVVVMAIGAGTVYALRDGSVLSLLPAVALRPAAASTTANPLELLSLQHAVDEDGAFTVTGLVQNPQQGREVTNVDAVVYLLDAGGQVIATGRAALERSTFRPGEHASFLIRVSSPVAVSRYRVGFRVGDDAVVSHVDRRRVLPGGTTGERVDRTEHAPVTSAPPAPRRTEG